MDIEKILKIVREQERVVLATRDRIERLRRFDGHISDNKTFAYERAKLIGMLDILDAMNVDRSEFNWIFNI